MKVFIIILVTLMVILAFGFVLEIAVNIGIIDYLWVELSLLFLPEMSFKDGKEIEDAPKFGKRFARIAERKLSVGHLKPAQIGSFYKTFSRFYDADSAVVEESKEMLRTYWVYGDHLK